MKIKWIVIGLLSIVVTGLAQTAITIDVDTGDTMIVWVETTQKDFADGAFEHNIYCTHRPFADSLPGNVEFVQRFDYNNDNWMDVIVSNVVKFPPGVVRDSFWVYWNTHTPPDIFTDTLRTSYPTGGSAEICGTDLNIDGYPDLVVANYRMYSMPGDTADTLRGGVTFFWGTDTGPDPSSYDSLRGAGFMEAVYVADLNKDGYLDLITGGSPGTAYTDFQGRWQGLDTIGIWWGFPVDPTDPLAGIKYSEEGDSLTTLVGKIPRHNFEVADFDKDGYYDIVAINYARDTALIGLTDTIPHLIFWGNDTGYSQEDTTQLVYYQPQAQGLTVADFDKDGWLDLVFTGLELDTFAFIYYGKGGREFEEEPDTVYPGRCHGGSIAADMDADGWLDLVFLMGNADIPVVHPLWLYRGGPNGFDDADREQMGPKEWNVSGGLIGDFNKDDELDLWVDDWVEGFSGVLWGPTWTTINQVRNKYDHHSVSWEIGNTYDRGSYEEYISSVYDAGMVVNWDGVFAIDSCPEGTHITYAVRTGNTSTPDGSWSGWYVLPIRHPAPTQYPPSLCGAVPDSLDSQYIQYKATFQYPKHDMAGLPVLYEVRLTYPPGIRVDPDRVLYRRPGQTADFYEWVISYSTVEDTSNMTISEYTKTDWGEPELLKPGGTEPLEDHNGDGIPDLPGLPPCRIVDGKPIPTDSLPFWVRREVPDDANFGDTDTTVVWGTLVNHNTVKDSAYLITIVEQLIEIVVEPDQIDTLGSVGKDSVPYPLWGTNLGNGPDIINLIPAGTREFWECKTFEPDGVTPLPDTDGDGVPDLGELRPNGVDTVPFMAWIIAPENAWPGQKDTTFVWGYSSVNSSAPKGKDAARLITVVPAETALVVDTIIYIQINPPDSNYIYRKFSPYPDSTTEKPYDLWLVNRSHIDSMLIPFGGKPDTLSVIPYTLPYVDLETHHFPTTTYKGPWIVGFLDEDENPLKDNNRDENHFIDLMNVKPGTTDFQMTIIAPPGLGYIVSDIDSSNIDTVWIKAFTEAKRIPGDRDTTQDTTFIKTTLVPPLDIHNYPNPFRGHKTMFVFSLPDDGKVTLKLFNRAGEFIKTLIADEFYEMGVHTWGPWYGKNESGNDVGPGTYLYPFYFKADGIYLPGVDKYMKGATIVKKALLLP